MSRHLSVLAALIVGSFGIATPARAAEPNQVTAIDILLAPDDVMMDRAKEANARLRADYANGFELDAIHNPHVTVIQGFVRTSDLDKVYAAVAKVLKGENPTSWELRAKGYYDIPVDKLGLAGIVIEPTQDLLRLQQKLIDAVAPFNSVKGTAEAFALRPDGKTISQAQATIDYVTEFVPKSSGKNYNPHVTIGLGTREFIDKFKAKPFKSFTFKARAVEVYQLGEFGTAQKLLWSSAPADPLASWNEGPRKTATIEFVAKVTKEGGPDFVAPAERIAVFDNDGTLWPEDPVPFELAFVFDRVKAEAAKHPEWNTKQPFKAVLDNDLPGLLASGKKGLVELLLATHAGMTTDEFDKSVRDWIATAEHPRFKRKYTELTYQPMQEVLAYLRANGFKTFIVSGGGVEFMRVWSEKVYGIPPEQVVGTMFKTKFMLKDDKPVLQILPEVVFIDDKDGKPVGIQQVIGRRPIACFGNSDGDLEMLQWTTIDRKPSFGLIVHHTDAEREYAYDAHPKSSGKLVEALAEAPKRGWTVVDMKKDWKVIFAFEK